MNPQMLVFAKTVQALFAPTLVLALAVGCAQGNAQPVLRTGQ